VFAFAAGIVGAFVRVVVDEISIPEVESVLLQVGLPLCLIPNEHDLIVATI
jgi:hypothetical protein